MRRLSLPLAPRGDLVCRGLLLGLLAALSLGCGSDPEAKAGSDGGAAVDGSGGDAKPLECEPPPADTGIHGYANGCYTMEAFDGAQTLRYLAQGATADRFAFGEETVAKAAHLRMRASDLGVYLFYDADRHFLAAATEAADGKTGWQLTRPAKLESKIDRMEDAFESPAEWRLQVSARDPKRYQLQHYATERYLTLTGLTADVNEAAIITLRPSDGCVAFPELTIDAEGAITPKKWADGDVWGIAEIHSHMFSDAGFGGGGLFHGAPFHRLGVESALPDCKRSHGVDGKRDLMGFFYDGNAGFDIAALLPVMASGQFAEFNHHTDGYPTFTDWPNSWRKSTHQTMYYRWVERAYLAGLRLVVQHATGNSVMCDLTQGTGSQKSLYSCNDMVSVDRTIARAHELERYIDAQAGGPGKGWLRIVKSPKEAREVINQGKMAVVLGIEISNLFDCFLSPPKGFKACTLETVRAKLDHYLSLDVRVLFPVHKYDNAFSAGDGSGGVIELGNFVNSGHYSNFVTDCPGISTTFDKGDVTFGGLNKPRDVYDSAAPFDLSGLVDDLLGTLVGHFAAIQEPALKGNYCQKHGLTPLGKALIQEMMVRGILIDIAHLPQRALVETYDILEKNDYPATKTHGDSNKGRVYKLGGLIGSGFGRCGDPKKPGNMGKNITNSVAAAVSNGAYPAEALAFDLNGFAGGPRPRFGKNKGCNTPQANPITYPFTSYDGKITFTQPHLGDREVNFNEEGMIHIGLLPELIEDARRDGMTDKALEPLYRSAEAYIRMWEKAEARAKVLKK